MSARIGIRSKRPHANHRYCCRYLSLDPTPIQPAQSTSEARGSPRMFLFLGKKKPFQKMKERKFVPKFPYRGNTRGKRITNLPFYYFSMSFCSTKVTWFSERRAAEGSRRRVARAGHSRDAPLGWREHVTGTWRKHVCTVRAAHRSA